MPASSPTTITLGDSSDDDDEVTALDGTAAYGKPAVMGSASTARTQAARPLASVEAVKRIAGTFELDALVGARLSDLSLSREMSRARRHGKPSTRHDAALDVQQLLAFAAAAAAATPPSPPSSTADEQQQTAVLLPSTPQLIDEKARTQLAVPSSSTAVVALVDNASPQSAASAQVEDAYAQCCSAITRLASVDAI